ncbi:MAG: hypothetical protein RL701_5417 [Pseudomonadota bacterium]
MPHESNPPTAAPPRDPACVSLQHDAFYKFVRLDEDDVSRVVAILRELTQGLLGTILVAKEGINGMLAGQAPALDAFQQALAHDPRLGGVFGAIEIKRSPCAIAPFQRMKVRHKAEILPLGIAGVDAVNHTGTRLDPAAWREFIAREDVVLIDNRNSFEFRLGRFKHAIDPGVHNFRDFPRYVEANLATWKAQGKRVAMYCTGGIRCEKTSAWMATMDMPVYELAGGILNYFRHMPDADKDWEGECFVFDNRVALDTHLQQTNTTLEDIYAGDEQDAWRLRRAQRLARNGDTDTGDDGGT